MPNTASPSLVKGYYDFPGGPFVPYETLRITFDDASRSAVVTEETDYDGNGISDDIARSTESYDEAWRPLRLVYEHDYGADGVVDYVMLERHEYDASGNEMHVVYDVSGNGTLMYRDDYRNTYDSKGRLIRTVFHTDVWLDTDFVVSEDETTTYTRDQHGRVVDLLNFRQTEWFTQSRRTEFRYSGIGNLLESTQSYWLNEDPPTINYRVAYEYAEGRSGQAK
jgi:hypothetical protein